MKTLAISMWRPCIILEQAREQLRLAGAFLWDVIKGVSVNWWAELIVNIKAVSTSEAGHINKVTNVGVQTSSSLQVSYLSEDKDSWE